MHTNEEEKDKYAAKEGLATRRWEMRSKNEQKDRHVVKEWQKIVVERTMTKPKLE